MNGEKEPQGAQGAQGEEGEDGLPGPSAGRYRETLAEVNRVAGRVVEAAIEVHRHLGPGYLESVYQKALEVELALQGLQFHRQAGFLVEYKGQEVGEGRMDLLVERCVIVEIKTVDRFSDVHVAQALSYLKATGLSLALLINFKVPVLLRGVKRLVRNQPSPPEGTAGTSTRTSVDHD